jgi:hypothetical protein
MHSAPGSAAPNAKTPPLKNPGYAYGGCNEVREEYGRIVPDNSSEQASMGSVRIRLYRVAASKVTGATVVLRQK